MLNYFVDIAMCQCEDGPPTTFPSIIFNTSTSIMGIIGGMYLFFFFTKK